MTRSPVCAAFAVLVSVGMAQAAPVTYSSRDAFDAALLALGATRTTETFESIPPALRGTNLPDTDPGTRVGATIGTTAISSPQPIGVQFVNGNTQLFSGFSNSGTAAQRFVSFTGPTASIAFGIDLVDYQSPDTAERDPLTITGLGVSQLLDTDPSQATPTFFGVIDAQSSTTSFSISRAARVLYPLTFDNVVFASAPAAEVPEPASLLLVGMGIAWAVGLRSVRRA